MNAQTKHQTVTPRQLQVLKLIAEFHANRCYSATIQELADHLGISRPTAFEHIAALREKGLLSATPGRARSLIPTRKGQNLLKNAATPPAGCADRKQPPPMQDHSGIPLLGRVAAGAPIEAIENSEPFSIPGLFGTGDDIFALQVTGDSMIDDGICDGDYVVCRRSGTAQNGRLVIALLDEENVTLKRFYKRPDHARLQPANKNYRPIYSSNCRVEAVVLGVLRKL